MTSAEYFQTPESLLPTELAFGTMLVRDSPSSAHQRAVGAFFIALHAHVRAGDLGDVWVAPLDVVLDEALALIVQPDLLYVSHERRDIVERRVYGPPDIVVEVLSPRPRVGDTKRRLGWFATYGVRECWLYEQQEQEVEVVTFGEGRIAGRAAFGPDERIVSACLPDFSLTPRQVVTR